MTKNKKGRAVIYRVVFLFVVVFASILGAAAVFHPESPLPSAWNPMRPLVVADPVTLVTNWKLQRTASDSALCLAALGAAASFADEGVVQNENPACGIATSVILSRVGASEIGQPVQTDCSIALRTAMWEVHGLQPAAKEILKTSVTRISQIGSYNCRAIRTPQGTAARMSTHATAEALDVTGFRFADGQTASLIKDWDDPGKIGAFLRDARDTSCRWFETTLSPDYNLLHADHFHLQSTGWGTCR